MKIFIEVLVFIGVSVVVWGIQYLSKSDSWITYSPFLYIFYRLWNLIKVNFKKKNSKKSHSSFTWV